MSGFKKAKKQKELLRMGLFGPSGAGKTYTSLRVMRGLVGKTGRIAVIDSEHRSSNKYADRFEFDVMHLKKGKRGVNEYLAAITEAAAEGYDGLVIDSLTHAWQELLEEVDRLGKTKYRGNKWSAWSDATPKQKVLVETILTFPGHVIATMRSKTEWTQEKTDKGKTKPVRVGLAPEQGKGIEYEFDLLMEMDTEHGGNVTKDRTGHLQDRYIEKPGEKMGEWLAGWLDGEAPQIDDDDEEDIPDTTAQDVASEADEPPVQEPPADVEETEEPDEIPQPKKKTATMVAVDFMRACDSCESVDDINTVSESWLKGFRGGKLENHAHAYVAFKRAEIRAKTDDEVDFKTWDILDDITEDEMKKVKQMAGLNPKAAS